MNEVSVTEVALELALGDVESVGLAGGD